MSLLKTAVVFGTFGLVSIQILPDAAIALSTPRNALDCRVISVVDGDTVRMWCPHHGVFRGRFIGFDAPEVFSPSCASELHRGTAATVFLRWQLLKAKDATFVFQGRDRYDRRLLDAWLDGKRLERIMIGAGHAVAYGGGKRGDWCA